MDTHAADVSFWDKKSETVSPQELRSLELKKLQETVSYAAKKSDFYKQRKKLSPHDAHFGSLEEFAERIPLTTKDDLLRGEKYENLCVPLQNVVEVHFSSGTSDKPVASFLTKNDIREGSTYLARTWYMQGVRKESVFAMLASYGLFSAGHLNHYAIQEIGAFIIPIGNAKAPRVLDLFREFSVDSCAAIASYYPYLIAMAKERNISLSSLNLEYMIAGGEPFSEKQRHYIEEETGASLYNQYGLCEINTGIAGECAEKNGLHILADYVYPEIIDPVTEKTLTNGEEGELVLTTFHKEASPLLRYRTGDITTLSYSPCPCGRTMPKISSINRRTTNTLFYKGVNVEQTYVSQLLETLSEYVNPYVWQMELMSSGGRDEAILKVVCKENGCGERSLDYITTYLCEKLGFKIKVRSFNGEEVAHLGESKLKYFLDNRNN